MKGKLQVLSLIMALVVISPALPQARANRHDKIIKIMAIVEADLFRITGHRTFASEWLPSYQRQLDQRLSDKELNRLLAFYRSFFYRELLRKIRLASDYVNHGNLPGYRRSLIIALSNRFAPNSFIRELASFRSPSHDRVAVMRAYRMVYNDLVASTYQKVTNAGLEKLLRLYRQPLFKKQLSMVQTITLRLFGDARTDFMRPATSPVEIPSIQKEEKGDGLNGMPSYLEEPGLF